MSSREFDFSFLFHFFLDEREKRKKRKNVGLSLSKESKENMQRPPPPSSAARSSLLLSIDSNDNGDNADEPHHHDDELEYLSSATLTRRKEALEAGDARAHAAPHRALYLRRNGDAARLFEAASRRLAREPGCVRALMIRASVLVKKGKEREGEEGEKLERELEGKKPWSNLENCRDSSSSLAPGSGAPNGHAFVSTAIYEASVMSPLGIMVLGRARKSAQGRKQRGNEDETVEESCSFNLSKKISKNSKKTRPRPLHHQLLHHPPPL